MRNILTIALLLSISFMAAEASLFKFPVHARGSQVSQGKDGKTDNSTVVPVNHDDDDDDDDDNVKPDYTSSKVKYYLNGVKGVWTGFMQGFYKNSKIELNERCISNKLTDNVYFIIDFTEGKEPIWKVAKFVVTIAKTFNDNLSYCGYEKLVEDLKKFCSVDGTCDPDKLMKNVTDKLFQFVGDANGIVAAIQQFPPQDKDDMFLDSLELGTNLGKIVRGLYNFTN
eukprot:403372065